MSLNFHKNNFHRYEHTQAQEERPSGDRKIMERNASGFP